MSRPIAVIDCETNPFAHGVTIEPFVWGYQDENEYHEFETFDDIVDHIRGKKMVIYAHNGGRFDFHFALKFFEPFSEIMVIGGRIAKFRIGECEFRDSMSILPVALREFEKDEFDYSLMLPENRIKPENKAKISLYLKHDCESLYTLVTGFIKQFGSHLTQATAALRTWQKISRRKPPKTTREFYENYSRYYYGGRVQCFQKGIIEQDFSVYDINSAYPFAMLSYHPISVEPFVEYHAPEKIVGHNFYTVKAYSPNGALPFRTKTDLLFPADDEVRDYHISGWELQAAIDTGSIEILDWLESHIFAETVEFGDYIHKFWNARKIAKAEGDKAGSLYNKLLMNSLYGKFAANPTKYKRYLIVDSDDVQMDSEIDLDDTTFVVKGKLDKWFLAERKLLEDEMRFYNVATGASITGYVRAYLWRAIWSCGLSNMLYCDTDSIASMESGNLSQGDGLGEWKKEGDFVRAGIAGKKMYVFENAKKEGGNKKASKGAKLTEEQLWKVASGETVTYYPEVPTFSLKRGISYVNRDVRMT